MRRPQRNYSRDFQSAKWGSTLILRSSNLERSMSALGHFRPFRANRVMSAIPPKADIRADEIDVRFVPLATKVQRSKSGLFDHVVGATKQRKRYVEAEALGGFQINDQFDLGGLLNWKVGRLFPLENPTDVRPE